MISNLKVKSDNLNNMSKVQAVSHTSLTTKNDNLHKRQHEKKSEVPAFYHILENEIKKLK